MGSAIYLMNGQYNETNMSNIILVQSSLIAVALHLWVNFIIAWDTWWIWTSAMMFPTLSRIFCQLGTFTSVWNHSVTTERAKLVDRLTVRTAAILDILTLPSIPGKKLKFIVTSMLFITLVSYIGAKRADRQLNNTQNRMEKKRFKLQRDTLHITVHASTTLANIIIANYTCRI